MHLHPLTVELQKSGRTGFLLFYYAANALAILLLLTLWMPAAALFRWGIYLSDWYRIRITTKTKG